MMDMVFLVWWWWSGGLEEEEYLLVWLDGWREGEARAARGSGEVVVAWKAWVKKLPCRSVIA